MYGGTVYKGQLKEKEMRAERGKGGRWVGDEWEEKKQEGDKDKEGEKKRRVRNCI